MNAILLRRSYRRWSPETQRQAEDLRAEGQSFAHIAAVLGFNPETVASHLSEEAAERHRARVLAYRTRQREIRYKVSPKRSRSDSVKRSPVVPAPAPEPLHEEGFGRVSLIDARRDQCRNPLWGREDKHRDVCGRRVALGRSFCPACLKRVYGPSEPFKAEAAE